MGNNIASSSKMDGGSEGFRYSNDFLDAYMRLVEDTESPRVYHVWSLLSAVGACLGRRVYLPFGLGRIYPNIYTLLVGSPATRKSTAINIMANIVRKSTGIRFAPENTGGKFQGLVRVMIEKEGVSSILGDDELLSLASADSLADVKKLDSIKIDFGTDERKHTHEADRQCMFVAASEFNTFIGHGNIEFLEFLGKMYDGEPFEYGLKNESMALDEPLMSLVGGTTPTNIAEAFPKAAIGQGFTSRVIFVYGGTTTYKDIPWPKQPDRQLMDKIAARFTEIYYKFEGMMEFDNEAEKFATSIYGADNPLKDGRFIYYVARRHTHFLKLAIIFAANRLSRIVGLEDVHNAHALLLATEKTMPDALGEYGMSPTAAASQQILDFICQAKEPVTQDLIWHWVRRDVRMTELIDILNELVKAKKIQMVRTAIDGNHRFIPFVEEADRLSFFDAKQTAPTTRTLQ